MINGTIENTLENTNFQRNTERWNVGKALYMPFPLSNVQSSCLNVEVSCFANYFEKDNPKPVNLLKWLQSDKYKNEVEKIRTITDKKERDRIKATLPAITPSSLLRHRKKDTSLIDKLISYSGLLQFDIDFKENTHIENWTELKTELMNWKNIAYCSLSVSGQGFWGLIPIAQPEKLVLHYKSVCNEFKNFGIKLDFSKGGNPTDLRGYSYDENGIFNHNAETYYKLYIEHQPQQIKSLKTYSTTITNNSEGIKYHLQQIEFAPDGQKWETLRKISYYFGGLVAGGILQESEAIESLKTAIRNNQNNVASLNDAYNTIEKCFANGLKEPVCKQNYNSVHVHKCDVNVNDFKVNIKEWEVSKIDPLKINEVISVKELVPDIIEKNNQSNISKESILIFSKYFKGFDNFFLDVVNGVYSINSCIVEIKGLYNYTITENEFIQLLKSKKQHYKTEFITNSKY